MFSGPVAYLLQAGPPASVGGPKLQFAERPLDAVTKSESFPTDFHVKMPKFTAGKTCLQPDTKTLLCPFIKTGKGVMLMVM